METQTKSDVQRLTQSLRTVGAISVVISGVVFMLQGLAEFTAYNRFLSFAAVTAVLALLGLFTGLKLREGQSARTFLGLAAAATPVLFSQLGAMLFSLVKGGEAQGHSLPSFLVVTAPSIGAVLGAGLATAALLGPVLYVGFASFYRTRAQRLLRHLLFGCALLLIPTRDPNWIAIVILAQAVLMFVLRERMRTTESSETESMIAFSLPAIPTAILVGRELFYDPHMIFGSSAFLWLASFAIVVAPLAKKPEVTDKIRRVAFGLAGAAWFCFATALMEWFTAISGADLMLSIYPSAMAVLLLDNSKRKSKPSVLKAMAFGLAIISPAATFIHGWGLATAASLLLLGLSVAALGFVRRNSPVFYNGIVTAGGGLLYFLDLGMRTFSNEPWLFLAIAGVAVILMASGLESQRANFGRWKIFWNEHFG